MHWINTYAGHVWKYASYWWAEGVGYVLGWYRLSPLSYISHQHLIQEFQHTSGLSEHVVSWKSPRRTFACVTIMAQIPTNKQRRISMISPNCKVRYWSIGPWSCHIYVHISSWIHFMWYISWFITNYGAFHILYANPSSFYWFANYHTYMCKILNVISQKVVLRYSSYLLVMALYTIFYST